MSKKDFFRIFSKNKESGLVIITVILFLVLTSSSKGFLNYFNLSNISRNLSIWVIIALAQAVVMVIGGMNLSIGSIGALSATITGYFLQSLGMPGAIAVIAGLIGGMLAGFFNGIIIVKTKLNAFIVTLATLFMFKGIVMGTSKGQPFTKIPISFTLVGRGSIFMIPNIFLISLGILIVFFIMFKFTLLGRRILATGSSLNAAKFSGINTDKIILFCHISSGLMAAFAGVLYVSRFGVAQPSIGDSWLLQSFAIAVIGGTSLSGGVLSVFGLLLGGLIILLIRLTLILLHIDPFWEQAFLGGLILLAVVIDNIRGTIVSKK
ncbi:MAG: ABC transporter permease [Candidatus Nealsonbacteria bacterium]|nr:MAG: ABC transporter permease [Candidatus Nealsonbacteria bacterium]